MPIVRTQIITASAASVSSLNMALSSVVTAGNALVLHATHDGGSTGPTQDPIDNVNNGPWSTALSTVRTNGITGIYYRLAISSGAAASTYRISINYNGLQFGSMAAYEYSGIGSFGAAASSVGPSSSPRPPAQTASTVQNLFSALGAVLSPSTQTARSTGSPAAMTITRVDSSNNVGGLLFSGESINNSSVTVQPTFRTAASTQWSGMAAIFIASTAGGGGGFGIPWQMGLMGVQAKQW